MMSPDAHTPCGPIGALRLIHPPAETGGVGARRAPGNDDASFLDARARIGRENALASALTDLRADDGRRIFAMRVAEALEGGRAAVLPPERRTRLVRIASMLGVRTFDAHLVIAIVQDGARRGEIETGNAAMRDDSKRETERRIGRRDRSRVAAQALAAALLGAAIFAALVGWVG